MSPLCFSWLLLWHLTMTRGGSHNRSRLDTGAQFMALLVSLKVSPQVTAHTVSNTSNCQHYPSTDLQYKHRQVPGNIAVYSPKHKSMVTPHQTVAWTLDLPGRVSPSDISVTHVLLLSLWQIGPDSANEKPLLCRSDQWEARLPSLCLSGVWYPT